MSFGFDGCQYWTRTIAQVYNMTRLKIGTAFAFSIAALTFAIQNFENVTFKFLIWEMVAPRAFILLTTFLMGVFVGLVFAVTLSRKRAQKNEPLESGPSKSKVLD